MWSWVCTLTAYSIRVLFHLARRPRTAEEIRDELTDRAPTRTLRALASYGLVEEAGGKWQVTPEGREFLEWLKGGAGNEVA